MSAAGDLTFEQARASLGGNAANYTDEQIEEMRLRANVFARLICDVYRGSTLGRTSENASRARVAP